MSTDFTNAIATIPRDTMAHALFAFTNSNDALAVAVPCDVVDAACYDAVFALRDHVCAHGVPDANGTGDIAGSDIIT
jgi:hypothetical protein